MERSVQRIAEKVSDPDPGFVPRDIPTLRRYLERWFDPAWLTAVMDDFGAWAATESAPVLQATFLHRPPGTSMLIAALAAARYWEGEFEQDSTFQPLPGVLRMARFAGDLAALELHEPDRFDDPAREYLQQRLLSDDQVWGAVHELTTCGYFFRKGATVEP